MQEKHPQCDESVRGQGGRVVGTAKRNLVKAMKLRVVGASMVVYRGPAICWDTDGISGRESEGQ